ncbi:MAG: response regulator transcription factor [Candidatus Omnitrophica bacterium]|nr:response regulator transcription factor [Candidatus Omnitrophota bacterium]
MVKKKILIVDDERDFSKLLKSNLEETGKYEVYTEGDGEKAIEKVGKVKPDLILLDLMMPGASGFKICKALKEKERFSAIPIIIVSAKHDDTDKVSCLDMGADDYIVKPFSANELDARIRAVLRRLGPAGGEDRITIGGKVTIDPKSREVLADGKKVELTNAEFLILQLLASRKTRVFSRTEILDYLWGEDKVVTDRTVDVHIRHLREKLGKAKKFIKNVTGAGYKVEETEE